jgi:hypothetical protein
VSNYRERFDKHTADSNSAIVNLMPELGDVIPGMTSTKARRPLRSISKLLGRVDKEGVRYPEYLATEDGNLLEQVISFHANIGQYTSSGAAYFAANALPKLLDFEQRLQRALGVNAATVRDIKNQQVAEMHSLVDSAQSALAEVQKARRTVTAQQQTSERALATIEDRRIEADTSAKKVKEIRELAEKLASGDARRGTSLERFIGAAKQKNEQVEALLQNAIKEEQRVRDLRTAAEGNSTAALSLMNELESIKGRADEILRGATQAGLAGAYKLERDRLSREQFWYAIVFYTIIVGVIAYAAIAIVPVFSKIIENGGSTATTVGESALLLAVRLVILIPAIWALLFTSRRHSKIETLQMDYAAKANTALAYSGYRDEMDDDEALAQKLRDGLLVRFLEHPERLLNKSPVSEKVDVGPEGVSYSSQTGFSSGRENADE